MISPAVAVIVGLLVTLVIFCLQGLFVQYLWNCSIVRVSRDPATEEERLPKIDWQEGVCLTLLVTFMLFGLAITTSLVGNITFPILASLGIGEARETTSALLSTIARP